jgi:2-amino-4-hydroxy-6-hydroxymethyldihydropteridine diphosphokinase
MPCCFLGLGGNVGNVAATFSSALDDLGRIDEDVHVVCTSSIYRTAAVGESAGSEFLNAVAEIETELNPLELLARLQAVETTFGRTHDVHWGPRPLDIDLLLYGEETVAEPRLVVPHPALWYRRFVLDPLAEIAGNALHPVRRGTIDQLRQRMLLRPFRLRVACEDVARRDHLLTELRRRFSDVQFEVASAMLPSGITMSAMYAALNPLENISVRGANRGGDLNSVPITVPDGDDGGVSFLSSVIVSATDQPVIVAGPLLT